jgi:hypothetical protein
MSQTTRDAGKAATAGLDPEVTIHNRLAEGHRYRLALDRALRSRLRLLSGRWELSMYSVGRILIQIDVLAPGGARWSLAVPVPEGPPAEDIVETVWAECARLAGSEGVGGGTP